MQKFCYHKSTPYDDEHQYMQCISTFFALISQKMNEIEIWNSEYGYKNLQYLLKFNVLTVIVCKKSRKYPSNPLIMPTVDIFLSIVVSKLTFS